MAMVGSLSTVHEAVEAIKTGLKGQEEGTVKVSQLTTCFGEVTNLVQNRNTLAYLQYFFVEEWT